MPLDVLNQIQSFANGGQVDKSVKQQANNVINTISQNPQNLQIVNSLYKEISKTASSWGQKMQLLIYCSNQLLGSTNGVQKTFKNLQQSIVSLDTSPIDELGQSINNIYVNNNKPVNIDIITNNNIINEISNSINQLKKEAMKGISISVDYNSKGISNLTKQSKTISAQSFSKGGRVHYTPSNTSKAKTGGQFNGKKHGDKEIAFVNAGQAILTEKAVKSGAKQSGMSVSSYINSLNSGNLSNIKKGRSFAEGGIVFSSEKVSGNFNQNKGTFDVKGIKFSGNLEYNDVTKIVTRMDNVITILSSIAKSTKGEWEALLKKDDVPSRPTGTNTSNESGTSQSSRQQELAQRIGQREQQNQQDDDSIFGVQEIRGEDIKNVGDVANKKLYDDLDRTVRDMGLFGELLKNSNTQIGLMAVGFVFIAKKIGQGLKHLTEFSQKQAQINKGFAQFKSVGNLFQGENMKEFANDMNLTRQQASKLTDTLRDVGVQGNLSFGQISTMANNIKEQFGALDTSMLQQAINLVKDLPKQQVDVLITGHGSLDDQANLMANLMNGGKIQGAAKLVSQGVFGQVEGITPDMSQKDKKTIQIQAKTNKVLDEIKEELNSWIPSWVTQIGTLVSAITSVVATTASIATGVMSIKAMAALMAKNNLTPGGGIKGLLGDNGNGISNALGRNVGSIKSSVLKTAGSLMLISAIAIILEKIGDWLVGISEKMDKEDKQERKASIEKNKKQYGLSLNTHKTSEGRMMDKAATNVGGTALKGAGAGLAIGAAIGTIIPGIGTAVGAAVGAAVGGIAGAVVGLTDAISKWEKDKFYNDLAQKNQKIIDKLEESKEINRKELQRQGYRQIDIRKQIINMERYSKQNKMIKQGVYSANQRKVVEYATNRNKAIDKIGGDNSSYSYNLDDAVTHANQAVLKQFAQVERQRESILNNNEGLTENDKKLQLNQLLDAQIASYQHLINTLNESIGAYEKLPSVIQSSIKNSILTTLGQKQKKNFIGTNTTASMNAKAINDNAASNNKAVLQQYLKDAKRIKDSVASVEKTINNNVSAVQNLSGDLSSFLGQDFSNLRNNDGTINQKLLSSLRQKTASFFSNRQDAYRQGQAGNEEAMKKGQAYRDVKYSNDFIGTQMESLSKMDEDKFQKKFSNSSTKKEYIKDLNAHVQEVRKKAQQNGIAFDFENFNSSDLNDFEQFMKKLATFQSIVSSVQTDIETERNKLVRNSEPVKKFEQSKGAKHSGKLEQLDVRLKSLSAASSSVTLEMNLQQKKFKKFIEAYDKSVNSFSSAIQNMLKSSDVLYQDLLLKARQQTIQYDSFGSQGATTSVAKMYEQEGFSLSSRKDAIDRSKELYISSAGKVNSQLEAGRSYIRETENGEQKLEYFDKLNQLGIQRAKAMNDKDGIAKDQKGNVVIDKDGNALTNSQYASQLQSELSAYESANKTFIEQLNNSKDSTIKGLLSVLGAYRSTGMDIIKQENQYKADFVNSLKSLPQALSKAMQFDYNSQKHLAMSSSVTAQMGNANEYGNYEHLAGLHSQAIEQIGRTSSAQLNALQDQYKKVKKNALARLKENMEKAKSDQEKLQIQRIYNLTSINLEKQYNENRVKAQRDAYAQLQKSKSERLQPITRQQNNLGAQKEMLDYLGAPIQMLFDTQQQIVQLTVKRASIEQQQLQTMERANKQTNGKAYSQKQIQEQKFKLAKASATALKAAFGSQKDAIDKLLGKMFGTFQQIGGIFGPDSEYMNAQKHGQGYVKNSQTGLIFSSNIDAPDGYKQRLFRNSASVLAQRGNKMLGGHGNGVNPNAPADSSNTSTSSNNVSSNDNSSYNISASNVQKANVSNMLVSNLIIDNFIPKNGTPAQGASTGGIVESNGIRGYSEGGNISNKIKGLFTSSNTLPASTWQKKNRIGGNSSDNRVALVGNGQIIVNKNAVENMSDLFNLDPYSFGKMLNSGNFYSYAKDLFSKQKYNLMGFSDGNPPASVSPSKPSAIKNIVVKPGSSSSSSQNGNDDVANNVDLFKQELMKYLKAKQAASVQKAILQQMIIANKKSNGKTYSQKQISQQQSKMTNASMQALYAKAGIKKGGGINQDLRGFSNDYEFIDYTQYLSLIITKLEQIKKNINNISGNNVKLVPVVKKDVQKQVKKKQEIKPQKKNSSVESSSSSLISFQSKKPTQQESSNLTKARQMAYVAPPIIKATSKLGSSIKSRITGMVGKPANAIANTNGVALSITNGNNANDFVVNSSNTIEDTKVSSKSNKKLSRKVRKKLKKIDRAKQLAKQTTNANKSLSVVSKGVKAPNNLVYTGPNGAQGFSINAQRVNTGISVKGVDTSQDFLVNAQKMNKDISVKGVDASKKGKGIKNVLKSVPDKLKKLKESEKVSKISDKVIKPVTNVIQKAIKPVTNVTQKAIKPVINVTKSVGHVAGKALVVLNAAEVVYGAGKAFSRDEKAHNDFIKEESSKSVLRRSAETALDPVKQGEMIATTIREAAGLVKDINEGSIKNKKQLVADDAVAMKRVDEYGKIGAGQHIDKMLDYTQKLKAARAGRNQQDQKKYLKLLYNLHNAIMAQYKVAKQIQNKISKQGYREKQQGFLQNQNDKNVKLYSSLEANGQKDSMQGKKLEQAISLFNILNNKKVDLSSGKTQSQKTIETYIKNISLQLQQLQKIKMSGSILTPQQTSKYDESKKQIKWLSDIAKDDKKSFYYLKQVLSYLSGIRKDIPSYKSFQQPNNSQQKVVVTSTPSQGKATVASTPSQGKATVASTPSQGKAIVTSTPSQGKATVASTPSQGKAIVTSTPSQGKATVTSTPSQGKATVSSQQGNNIEQIKNIMNNMSSIESSVAINVSNIQKLMFQLVAAFSSSQLTVDKKSHLTPIVSSNPLQIKFQNHNIEQIKNIMNNMSSVENSVSTNVVNIQKLMNKLVSTTFSSQIKAGATSLPQIKNQFNGKSRKKMTLDQIRHQEANNLGVSSQKFDAMVQDKIKTSSKVKTYLNDDDTKNLIYDKRYEQTKKIAQAQVLQDLKSGKQPQKQSPAQVGKSEGNAGKQLQEQSPVQADKNEGNAGKQPQKQSPAKADKSTPVQLVSAIKNIIDIMNNINLVSTNVANIQKLMSQSVVLLRKMKVKNFNQIQQAKKQQKIKQEQKDEESRKRAENNQRFIGYDIGTLVPFEKLHNDEFPGKPQSPKSEKQKQQEKKKQHLSKVNAKRKDYKANGIKEGQGWNQDSDVFSNNGDKNNDNITSVVGILTQIKQINYNILSFLDKQVGSNKSQNKSKNQFNGKPRKNMTLDQIRHQEANNLGVSSQKFDAMVQDKIKTSSRVKKYLNDDDTKKLSFSSRQEQVKKIAQAQVLQDLKSGKQSKQPSVKIGKSEGNIGKQPQQSSAKIGKSEGNIGKQPQQSSAKIGKSEGNAGKQPSNEFTKDEILSQSLTSIKQVMKYMYQQMSNANKSIKNIETIFLTFNKNGSTNATNAGNATPGVATAGKATPGQSAETLRVTENKATPNASEGQSQSVSTSDNNLSQVLSDLSQSIKSSFNFNKNIQVQVKIISNDGKIVDQKSQSLTEKDVIQLIYQYAPTLNY